MSEQKQQWGTRLGVILAVAGSAVGLGNFLRFPGQAASNGGGAFMIPYFCALLFLGIPIGWAEWAMARYGGRKGLHSAPAVLGVIGKGSIARYLGVIGVLIPLAVSFYYTYIEAWCLGYTWQYLTGGIGVDVTATIDVQTKTAKDYYDQFVGNNADGIVYGGSYKTLVFWVLTFFVNILLVYRGIAKGIEKFCSWAMPAMAVCAFIVLIRVLTLGTPDADKPDQNVVKGLGYMWNPDFGALTDAKTWSGWSEFIAVVKAGDFGALANAKTWLAAAGQIFFSLSVGFGVILNYASYMRKKDDVVLSGLTASATNELFEVGFGGLITLTASFIFLGLSGTAAAVQTGSFGLGFTTLPVVFAHMGGFGNFIGAVWFFMLFLAAITSSVSMYQPALAFFHETLGWTRQACTALLVSICAVGSFLVMYYSKDGVFFSTIDDWVGTFLIFVLAGVQIICFSWVFGIERGWKEMHEGAHIRIPGFYKFVMQWVAPTYLLTVFFFFCKNNLFGKINEETGEKTKGWLDLVIEEPRRQGALALVAVVTILLVTCLTVGEKRWRSQNIDIDDRQPLTD
jgi:SNF family Na+-dependent transporter